MQQITIHVTVNDEAYIRTVPVNMTLLQFLREELHLTGPRRDAMRESAAPAPCWWTATL